MVSRKAQKHLKTVHTHIKTYRNSYRTCLFLGTTTFPQNSITRTSCTLFAQAIFFASAKTVRLMSFFFFSFCYSDILAFFQGSPDGSIPGRDDLAKEIAAHAHEFVQERWREEDMRSFMYLLILEVSLVFAHPTKSTFWC